MPITIDAMTVRHITNEMVRDKSSFRDSAVWNQLQDLIVPNTYVMVTHNAAFDDDMLKKERIEPKSVICTLKLACYFDKEGVIPKYGLQYLMYYLSLNVDAVPHTALAISWSLRRFLIEFTQKHAMNSGIMPLPR
jgi:exodeoxyribonuclease X